MTHGLDLYVRLAAATIVLLLPGVLVSRALRFTGLASAFVWSNALVAAALAVTFAVGASLTLTLVLVLAAGAVAAPFAWRRRSAPPRYTVIVLLAGVVFGAALWGLEGIIQGDALFHLGRMRKLDDFGSLS